MGLDSYLFRRGKTAKAKIINALDKSKNEIAYWRKCWEVHAMFCSYSELDPLLTDYNCEEILITKENLKEILKNKDLDEYTKKVVTEALNDTDFENEEVFYYAWF